MKMDIVDVNIHITFNYYYSLAIRGWRSGFIHYCVNYFYGFLMETVAHNSQ